ncbi:hypothetical protein BKA70DRAFT_866685 [Coprinopsis sp. MPI-PUGE-AT-0042]|nr:hypothetical protein BKA70DRAFT_866685 [Coprinopsis sp. MPI-PUGE-AT-0042]
MPDGQQTSPSVVLFDRTTGQSFGNSNLSAAGRDHISLSINLATGGAGHQYPSQIPESAASPPPLVVQDSRPPVQGPSFLTRVHRRFRTHSQRQPCSDTQPLQEQENATPCLTQVAPENQPALGPPPPPPLPPFSDVAILPDGSRITSLGSPSQSPPIQPGAPSAKEVYERSLLLKEQGFPLFNPRPLERPVRFGDFGILCQDGFDSFGNLFDPNDQQEFSIDHPPRPKVRYQPEKLQEGLVMTEGIGDVRRGADAEAKVPNRLEIHCREAQGAALVLTSSGDLETLTPASGNQLGEYLRSHGAELILCLQQKHHLLPGQSLYVVTGTIKSDSWAIAVHTSPMREPYDQMVLSRREGTLGPPFPTHEWTRLGNADARCEGSKVIGGDDRRIKDQCLFLRGFLLSPSLDLGQQTSTSGNSSGGDSASSPDSSDSENRDDMGGKGGSANSGRLKSPEPNHHSTSSGGSFQHQLQDIFQPSYYPSQHINDMLLENGNLAITHDDDWIDSLKICGNYLDDEALSTLVVDFWETRLPVFSKGVATTIPVADRAEAHHTLGKPLIASGGVGKDPVTKNRSQDLTVELADWLKATDTTEEPQSILTSSPNRHFNRTGATYGPGKAAVLHREANAAPQHASRSSKASNSGSKRFEIWEYNAIGEPQPSYSSYPDLANSSTQSSSLPYSSGTWYLGNDGPAFNPQADRYGTISDMNAALNMDFADLGSSSGQALSYFQSKGGSDTSVSHLGAPTTPDGQCLTQVALEQQPTPGPPPPSPSSDVVIIPDGSSSASFDGRSQSSLARPHSLSEQEVYERSLLPKGQGFPLFNPLPFQRPVKFGDFGIVGQDGFEAFGNLFDPNDQQEFSILNPPQPIATRQPEKLHEGQVIATGIEDTRRLDVDAKAPDRYEFHCRETQGAALALTSSGELETLTPASRSQLKEYLCSNGTQLMIRLRQKRHLQPGQSLYVVTGTIKSDSWAIAVHTSPMQEPYDQMVLTRREDTPEDTSPTYEWASCGSADARCGTSKAIGEDGRRSKDQCLFLRGFLLTPSLNLEQQTQTSASSNSSGGDFKPSPDLSTDSENCDDMGGSAKSGLDPNHCSTSSRGSIQHQLQDIFQPASLVQPFPAPASDSKPYFPSRRINNTLLENPNINLAITHDDEWRDSFKIRCGYLDDGALSTLMADFWEENRASVSKDVATTIPVARRRHNPQQNGNCVHTMCPQSSELGGLFLFQSGLPFTKRMGVKTKHHQHEPDPVLSSSADWGREELPSNLDGSAAVLCSPKAWISVSQSPTRIVLNQLSLQNQKRERQMNSTGGIGKLTARRSSSMLPLCPSHPSFQASAARISHGLRTRPFDPLVCTRQRRR